MAPGLRRPEPSGQKRAIITPTVTSTSGLSQVTPEAHADVQLDPRMDGIRGAGPEDGSLRAPVAGQSTHHLREQRPRGGGAVLDGRRKGPELQLAVACDEVCSIRTSSRGTTPGSARPWRASYCPPGSARSRGDLELGLARLRGAGVLRVEGPPGPCRSRAQRHDEHAAPVHRRHRLRAPDPRIPTAVIRRNGKNPLPRGGRGSGE